ncbi:glycosyltransferase family 2 protein [Hufsiella ginkgonis]|uniref:Glycosyltransferase n=1 Tax=Hufsiella ginkgonis TaxID=2695274 RepID=A0A7K1XXX3_9SPHI|nr:glycosyltransferase [Hufsiella ginkgonis]MXV15793.1 glycosyltransferase [Hufsiella ginkgonis]
MEFPLATISIIVPVYNKLEYLDDCIQSILNQSFKDIELILVNDGSTDGSQTKCRDYAMNDSRIVVVNQHNQGVSAARNAGVSWSSGLYIGFVDADDTIEPDMYELLLKNSMAFDADISVCRMKLISFNKTTSHPETTGTLVFSHDEALSSYFKGEFDQSANNKLYKAAIARQIQFEGHIYEDILYTCRAFLAAGKTVLENTVKYNYIVRANSASMTKFNLDYMETIAVSAKMVQLVSASNKCCIAEAKSFDVMANISLLNLLLLTKKNTYVSQYNKVVDNLKGHATFILEAASVRKKHKYAFQLFSVSPVIYTWVMYLYCFLTRSDVVTRS